MASFEDSFSSSVLEVIAPQSSLEFPTNYTGSEATEWLNRLYAESTDRRVAFFDENIDFILVARFPDMQIDADSTDDAALKPSVDLLAFLAHLQISYDTSYISSAAPPTDVSAPEIGRPPVPPRTTSINKSKPGALIAAAHPSIFPPSTPHPIPSAAESDRQYVQAQGTPLVSGVWGEQPMGSVRSPSDGFALLRNQERHEWVALYRMSVLVRFMTTKFPDPLLSLTVSATLREKPLPTTPARRVLANLVEEAGGFPRTLDSASPIKAKSGDDSQQVEDIDDLITGFVEVNLLEGLQADPSFLSESQPPLYLPSTRLGPVTRRTAYALPPDSSKPFPTIQKSTNKVLPPINTGGKNNKVPVAPAGATFRKSFRKTMKIVSGFHVRMRTVFVPYFLLPQSSSRKNKHRQSVHANSISHSITSEGSGSDDDEAALQERELRQAGNEEHTVVLSVEIENQFQDTPTPGMPNYSFQIERADVSVSGSGAKTIFVGWGDSEDVFPVRIGPREQVNLLYAVTFLRAPEVDEFSLTAPPKPGGNLSTGTQGRDKRASVTDEAQELQRAVSINISVRPFERALETVPPPGSGLAMTTSTSMRDGPVLFPTHIYQSHWSCKLNFSSSTVSTSNFEVGSSKTIVLPTPASPFPSAPVPAVSSPTFTPPTTSRLPFSGQAFAGSKRFVFSSLDSPALDRQWQKMRSPVNYQGPTAMLNPANQPEIQSGPSTPTAGFVSGTGSRSAYVPPSAAAAFVRSPTTYNMPSSQDPYFAFSTLGAGQGQGLGFSPTEAVDEELSPPRTPAYPAYPSSPSPLPATPFWQAPITQQLGTGLVVPSVDMRRDRGGAPLPTPGLCVSGFPMGMEIGAEVDTKAKANGEPIIVSIGLLPIPRKGRDKANIYVRDMIYPLDQFTLDIFVYNQSSWTRRFEVSYPDERRRRRKGRNKGDANSPGILPLENRVRVGPLLPSTCQSVRMDFLALTPGVHSIEELILTDTQTNYTMHLGFVMDVVVHEPPDTGHAVS